MSLIKSIDIPCICLRDCPAIGPIEEDRQYAYVVRLQLRWVWNMWPRNLVGETVHGCVSYVTPAIDVMGVLDLGTNDRAESEKPLSNYDLRTWNRTLVEHCLVWSYSYSVQSLHCGDLGCAIDRHGQWHTLGLRTAMTAQSSYTITRWATRCKPALLWRSVRLQGWSYSLRRRVQTPCMARRAEFCVCN